MVQGAVKSGATISGKLPEWYMIHKPLLSIVYGKMYHGLHNDKMDYEWHKVCNATEVVYDYHIKHLIIKYNLAMHILHCKVQMAQAHTYIQMS